VRNLSVTFLLSLLKLRISLLISDDGVGLILTIPLQKNPNSRASAIKTFPSA
jgi:hypothetical protein